MANVSPIIWIAGGVALLLILKSSTASGATQTAGFDLNQLSETYGPDNVNRLINLGNALDNAINPDNGQPLTTFQKQLMLAQALHETGLFTSDPNYHLMDSYDNYAGLTSVHGGYAQYANLNDFVSSWLGFLTKNNDPIAATSVNDFVTRLKSNGYFTDNINTYMNAVQSYYNLLSNTAV